MLKWHSVWKIFATLFFATTLIGQGGGTAHIVLASLLLSCFDGQGVRIRGPHPEWVDDNVVDRDHEDNDRDQVVDDLGRPDLRVLVDVQVAHDQEQDADYDLQKVGLWCWLLRKELMVLKGLKFLGINCVSYRVLLGWCRDSLACW